MNEKTLGILLIKLNIHLNDLDLHNLYAYLVELQTKNSDDDPECTFRDVLNGRLVFKSLNGM